MKWLKTLENSNTSFHVHLLRKEEFILLQNRSKYKHIIYILEGYAQVLRVFTNSEKVCLQILSNNQIITSHKKSITTENHYDLVLAITNIKIITIPLIESGMEAKRGVALTKEITGKGKEAGEIIGILSHRNTKKRIIQLLIVLTKRFGQIKDNRIIIPIHLTHQTIADITGSQRITVSKVMISLKYSKIINYNSKSIIIHSITRLIQT